MSGVSRAVVLAAGRGSRLGSLTASRPKPLLPIDGELTLIGRQLRLMAARGVERVTVVVGYRAEVMREVLSALGRPRVDFRENLDWATTGSGWSLAQAADVLRAGDPVLLTHGDIVYDEAMLDLLLAAPGSATVADRTWEALTGDEVLAYGAGGRLAGMAKGPAPDDAAEHGEFVGLSRFDPGFAAAFGSYCVTRAGADRRLDYELPLLADFVSAGGGECAVLYAEHLAWRNVNDQDDLADVRRRFAPSRA